MPEPDERAREDVIEDARGLLCPLPVIRLGERMREVAPGRVIVLLADDPMAEDHVRQWCRGHGPTLEAVETGAELDRRIATIVSWGTRQDENNARHTRDRGASG